MTQSLTPYGEVLPPRIRSRTMENAVTLMWCGAGLSLANVVVSLAFRGRIEDDLRRDVLTSSDATSQLVQDLMSLYVAFVVVSGLVCACLWAWMAIANGNGRPWARLVASSLAGVNTLTYLSAAIFTLGVGPGQGDLTIARTVIGLLGVVLGWSSVSYLWHRESAAVYAVPRY